MNSRLKNLIDVAISLAYSAYAANEGSRKASCANTPCPPIDHEFTQKVMDLVGAKDDLTQDSWQNVAHGSSSLIDLMGLGDGLDQTVLGNGVLAFYSAFFAASTASTTPQLQESALEYIKAVLNFVGVPAPEEASV